MKQSARGDRWYYSYLPGNIAGGATSTLIPLFALILGASAAEVGIIAAAASVASVPAFMLWGGLSDKSGKRRVFAVIGFGGMSLSFLLMAASMDVPHLYLSNILLGALSAAAAPVGSVLIMETSKRAEWPDRLAVFSRIGGIGFIAGLAVGAFWLQGFSGPWGSGGSMRALFLAGALLSALSAAMAWRWIRDPEVAIKRSHIPLAEHLYLAVERVRYLPWRLLHFFTFFNNHGEKRHEYPAALKMYYVSVILLFSGFTAFYTVFPVFLAGPVGFSSSQIFAIYIASQVASASIYAKVGRFISRFGARKAQMAGATARILLFPFFLSLVLFPIGVGEAFVAALVIHGFIGASWALINVAGSTIVSRLAPKEGRAQTFGLYNAVQGIGSIAGPLLGGFTAELYGYGGGFALSSGIILGGVLILAGIKIKED